MNYGNTREMTAIIFTDANTGAYLGRVDTAAKNIFSRRTTSTAVFDFIVCSVVVYTTDLNIFSIKWK